MKRGEKKLHIYFPKIFSEIDLENKNNQSISLLELSIGSNKKIVWKCENGHQWTTSVAKRTDGSKCPFCSGKKTNEKNSFGSLKSELLGFWDFEKNHVNPFNIAPFSNKKFWFKCSKNHNWEATVDKISMGRGCPYCSGKKICNDNSLKFLNPELAREWHPTKNGILDPDQVTKFSTKKVWWLCEHGHEWQAVVSNRSNGTGCKKCNNPNSSILELKVYHILKFVFEDVENQFPINAPNFKKGKFDVDIFIKKYNFAVEYDGVYFHKKENKVKSDRIKSEFLEKSKIKLLRIREMGLPKVSKNEISYDTRQKLQDLIPKIFENILKNSEIEEKHLKKMREVLELKDVEVIVPKDFLFYKLQKENLIIQNSKLAEEWDYFFNGNLKPEHVTTGSSKKVGWICKKNYQHKWQATVYSRARRKRGCPFCAGRKKHTQ